MVRLTVDEDGLASALSPMFCRRVEFAMTGSFAIDTGVKLQPSLLHTGSSPSKVSCMAALYIQFDFTSVKAFASILPGIFAPSDGFFEKKVSE